MANSIPQSTTAESLYKYVEDKFPEQLNGDYAIIYSPKTKLYYWYPRTVIERNNGQIDEELNENLARKHGDKKVIIGDEPANKAMDLAAIASGLGGLVPPVGIAAPAITYMALSGIDQARDKERQEDLLVPAIQTGILGAGTLVNHQLKKPTDIEKDNTEAADAIAEETADTKIEKAKAERAKQLEEIRKQRQAEMMPDPEKARELRVDSLGKLLYQREKDKQNPNIGDEPDMDLAARVDETKGNLTRKGWARDELNKFSAEHPGLSGYDWDWNSGRSMDDLRAAADLAKTLNNKKSTQQLIKAKRQAFADLLNAKLPAPMYLDPSTTFGQQMIDDAAHAIYNVNGKAKYNDLNALLMHEPTKYGTVQGYATRSKGSTDAKAAHNKKQDRWMRDYALNFGGLTNPEDDAKLKEGYRIAEERGKKYPSYDGPDSQNKNKFMTNKEWKDIDKWATTEATPVATVDESEIPPVDEQAIRDKQKKLERAKARRDNFGRIAKTVRNNKKALARLLTATGAAATPVIVPIAKRQLSNEEDK